MASKLSISSTIKLNSGYSIPVLGFGWTRPKEEATKACSHALSVGYRHIDSASAYSNQGESAAAIPGSGVPRESIFFTTKVPSFDEDQGYESTKNLVDKALADTKLTYLDLVLIHWPHGAGPQGRKDAWRALVDSVDAGKIRSIGVSNYGVHHLDELEAYIKELEAERGVGKGGVISVGQWEIHPWLVRDDIVKWCRDRNIVVEAYCPIVRGQRLDEPSVVELANKYAKTPAQILLRWSIQRGYVPLVKSVTPSRIEENAAVFDFELSDADVAALATKNYDVCSWDPTIEPLEK
ncbi:Aldo/keto reductase, related to diketogulonate reductase [Geosmithia morbida]|uniref:Aldo/keto reductase, related to diketogulonate reductase n=1 Tax=Geosmithia morbida TaxID=1094350 RepID=A0A9P4YNH1_9HYPO|nr:Aldo/keto reductase, related to diketogulonate reductase [Geosmithia morbida]KAF4119820.1 Aldo/keto reductase, related to diketogulonate reductase [Geosmithia morbida]